MDVLLYFTRQEKLLPACGIIHSACILLPKLNTYKAQDNGVMNVTFLLVFHAWYDIGTLPSTNTLYRSFGFTSCVVDL